VLVALSCASRDEVDDLLARAIAAGGKPWLPVMDQGPMYGASFADPDGHVWELLHMDMSQLPEA
jgi:predicted lactoylglutathione lyase